MWPFRRVSRSHTPPLRARLRLEALDLRLAPAYDPLTGEWIPDPPPPEPNPPIAVPVPEANAAPRIINFVAVETGAGMWTFTGEVVDEAPGGLTITFGGVPVSLQGKTTTTDASGHFAVAFEMNMDGTDDGLATAQTVDSAGQVSNVAVYGVHPS